MALTHSIWLLLSISILNVNSQKACIWGRDIAFNRFINGEYQYQSEYNGAPWFLKKLQSTEIYLWRKDNQYIIAKAQQTMLAFCTISTSVPWECGLNQWMIWNGTEFVMDPQVYALQNSCPEWECDGIQTDIDGYCNGIFPNKIDRNVWSNQAGNLYFWFSQDEFRWICSTDDEYSESYIANPTAMSEAGWVDITKGDEMLLNFEYPYKAIFAIQCLERNETVQSHTSIPSAASYCDNIIVEIDKLDGISTDYFRRHPVCLVFWNFIFQRIGDLWSHLNFIKIIIIQKMQLFCDYMSFKITIGPFKASLSIIWEDLWIWIYWSSYPRPTQTIPILEISLLHIIISILILFLIFTIASLIDAKCFHINDYFSPMIPILAAFDVSDTFLDVIFAIYLSLNYMVNDETHHGMPVLIPSIVGFIFIIIPFAFSIYQLMREAWFTDENLSDWRKEYKKDLDFFSIITGSSYTAVQVANCGAFNLDIFNMGLTKQERIKFNVNRVIGVVYLKNIPQLVIQTCYLLRFGVEYMPILSAIFSITSIVLTVLIIYTQREMINNREMIMIEFDLIGDEIEPELSTKTNGIKREMCVLLGIQETFIEIQRPKLFPQGLRFKICLYLSNIDQALDYSNIVRTAELEDIIQTE